MSERADPPVVYVVDDEESVRRGFALLIRSAGLACRCFDSAEKFLAGVDPRQRGCILLDITMPAMTGLQLQEELSRRKLDLPVISISARDDLETSKLARQLGARLFFRKPVDDQALLDAIQWVLEGNPPSPEARAEPQAKTPEEK